ncbi:MAG: GIY-YIG nuclease family protein [Candidatus Diapherotrites archaeon]|nr:GIY-YIG nuclease family protein [Candidatus Diapherotrites archaeon]
MIQPKDVSTLPSFSGCYLFKDENGNVLYVGKAKNLKKRVSNYFQKKEHDTKTALLVTKIKNIDFIVTKTEGEALLLENNLIKLHYPKFNLDLKDSRRYAYIRLSEGEIPYLEVARIRGEEGEYFGPFTSGAIRKVIIPRNSKN